MIGGILSRLARVRFTLGYAAALLTISCVILALGPHAHDVIVQRASTNLHNLAHGHLGTLLGSALVVDAGPLYFWLPFLTCLLALAELHLRTIRLIVAFVVGHIGATLLVAAALAAAVEFGWLPLVRHPGQRRGDELRSARGARSDDGGDSPALACGLGRLVGSGGPRRGDHRQRLHRCRPHRRRHPRRPRIRPIPAADPLDAGAPSDAGGVLGLRLPDARSSLGHHGGRAGLRVCSARSWPTRWRNSPRPAGRSRFRSVADEPLTGAEPVAAG